MRKSPSTTRPAGKSTRTDSFEVEAESILSRLQAVVSHLRKTKQGMIARATDLQHLLGLQATLAWQLFRWATADDPFATVMFIPRPDAMAKAVAAAQGAGFSQRVIEEVETAYAEFVDFVEHHAGDRANFDAMIAALERAPTPQIELRHRRAAFRANTQIWGISQRALYSACIYHDTGEDRVFGSIVVKGLIELRKFRPIESIRLSQRRMVVEQNGEFTPTVSEFMIFEDFCSGMREGAWSVQTNEDGEDAIYLQGMNSRSRATVFIGVCVRRIEMDSADRSFGVGGTVFIPCENLILDLLVPQHLSSPTIPNVETVGVIDNPMKALRKPSQSKMPGKETGQYLGTSFESLRCPEIPGCPELLRSAIRRVGWESTQYHLYRARIRFPILHAHVGLETLMTAETDLPDLLEGPGGDQDAVGDGQ